MILSHVSFRKGWLRFVAPLFEVPLDQGWGFPPALSRDMTE
jgi:hypothetical protein